MLSHQWVRELKRRGHRSAAGVHFRVGDSEPVWAGKYNQPKSLVSASAAATLRTEKLLGYEVILPRAIASSEISAVRTVPAIGWRFKPDAKGNAPFCLCAYCNRGEINNRRMRNRLDPNGERA